jgi:signal transduction histidine kinase
VAVTTALVVLAVVSAALHPSASVVSLTIAEIVLAGISVVSALLLARSVAGRRIAPTVALPGLIASLALTGEVLNRTAGRPPGDAYVTAASQGAWVLVFVAIAAVVLVFPSGRAEGRPIRWVRALLVVDAGAFMVLAATAPGPYPSPDEHSPHVFGTLPAALSDAGSALTLLGLLALLLAVVVITFRRARGARGRIRRQFAWLSLAVSLVPATLLATWASYLAFGRADVVLGVGLATTYAVIPAAVAIALLRPDLYDAQHALAGTLTHLVLSALLLTAWSATSVAVGLVVPDGKTVVPVVAAAACALFLSPVRARVQRLIDRWFYPTRKAALTAVRQLHADTASGLARPEQLTIVLREALDDPDFVMAYRSVGTGSLRAVDGAPVLEDADHDVPVALGGEVVGTVRSTRCSATLLHQIGREAAPLLELVRLRGELRRALDDAESSRERLVRASYEERARLERDLHDGAQQRLVALGLHLRLAQLEMGPQQTDVVGLLDEAVAQLGTAVSELRQLAHGIRPSCLDDGLGAALSSLVRRSPVPITVYVSADDLAADLETTAYYVAAEAVTNALKHAGASTISLNIESRGQSLHIQVRDDGHGGVRTATGPGLAAIGDRVAAHRGTLSVTSPVDGGTFLEAVLPCGS